MTQKHFIPLYQVSANEQISEIPFYLLNWKNCGQGYKKWTCLNNTGDNINCYTLLPKKLAKRCPLHVLCNT